MAVACTSFNDRHSAVLYDTADQSGAATRDQHIHKFIQTHELRGHRPVCIGDQLQGVFRQSRTGKSGPKPFHDFLIGLNGITSAF